MLLFFTGKEPKENRRCGIKAHTLVRFDLSKLQKELWLAKAYSIK